MTKPVYILGISAFYHDSAAALLKDGRILAAAQEERFSRKKHDADMPTNAIGYCLSEAHIGPEDLDYVVFYEKPLIKFDRLLETWLDYAPRGFGQFLTAIPQWLHQKLQIPRHMDKVLGGGFKKSFIFTEHHEAHAASAFFPSPFQEAAVVTLDGVGEWTTASIGIGKDSRIDLLYELHFPHSLGLLYSAFTFFCGFKVNSGEYKLMGLAPYGRPVYADLILNNLLDLKEDGSFRLNMDFFTYGYTNYMIGKKFAQLFGGPARKPESPLTQREMDIAASIQKVTEEVMLRIVRFAGCKTGMKNLVMAGGVALNCVGNGRILREGPFDNLWIQPAAGDAGGALGAALFVHYQLLNNPRIADGQQDQQEGSLLGPAYSNEYVRSRLNAAGAKYRFFDQEEDLLARVAEAIEAGQVVGWFQGRMEFGPRALGSRSILGDARNEHMQSRMNLKVKFRESFRPFAPSILQEDAAEYFELCQESPYMLLTAAVRPEHRIPLTPQQESCCGLDKLKVKRSMLPAVTHVDYSARIQTVNPQRHGRFYRLLKQFRQKTGCPAVINTSFNVRGEPIVCTPDDALKCFIHTDMDVLAIENFILYKKEQPQTFLSAAGNYPVLVNPD
ncbi:MAG TPA: carbamoyltransferase [Anaerohalosphaeraceae bacterium]|nr:carbamoyltransferase [Anaerohalosphaeraceae bacterium]HOL31258.1 carbamoyltransferase [Anaerohalosphaeraceae bacterium]HOM76063.1 carbamoyltransferase [Anaerohalosphaeraceae bacterium]HPC64262.1 carbamoyltransferase [Anaerohalosphaeraceae bacterium]HRS71318.1 carbamoyltransferase [Anaerohalosphaeraceae bacterium]